jgi:hypothetical protein
MRGPASAPLAFDSLAEPCPSSGGPRAAPTATCRRACVVPPRHRSPSTRSPAPVRPQADRALRRRSLVGAHAWSRLDAARLRLARRPLSVLRRTARCADGLSSARMRGPASHRLPSPRSPDPARPQADRALRRRPPVGAHAWSRLDAARLQLARRPCPSSGGPRAAPTASFRRACVVPPRRRSPSARSPPCPSSGGPRAAPTASHRRACVVPPRHRSPSTRSVFGSATTSRFLSSSHLLLFLSPFPCPLYPFAPF